MANCPKEIIEDFAYQIRFNVLQMVYSANASHVGGALSCTDILAALYNGILTIHPGDPAWEKRDRFIFSKGHCCTALYATLALKGFFPIDELKSYGQNKSRLMCHASHLVPGVEWSTGSLGHGLSLGCGQALAAKRKQKEWRVFVLLSDGDMNEGATWEACLFARQHMLGNLVAIVDYNRQQGLGDADAIMSLDNLQDKLQAFGWDVSVVDGHNETDLLCALQQDPSSDIPRCIVANTIKGKGVAYMENQVEWHYRAPTTPELLKKALEQLAACYNR